MKRAFLALMVLMVLCLSAPVALADYFNPPEWDNDPNFTHQSWYFKLGNSPKDAEVDGNPFGLATAYELNQYGQYVGGVLGSVIGEDPRTGGWRFEGPVSGVFAEIHVPNQSNPNMWKEFWFQATFRSNNFEGPSVVLTAKDEEDRPFTIGDWDIELLGFDTGGGYWARGTVIATSLPFPQPSLEVITLAVQLEDQEYFVVDQLDIDTHCVPEPSTPAMLLGLAAVCVVTSVWRRRRRATC